MMDALLCALSCRKSSAKHSFLKSFAKLVGAIFQRRFHELSVPGLLPVSRKRKHTTRTELMGDQALVPEDGQKLTKRQKRNRQQRRRWLGVQREELLLHRLWVVLRRLCSWALEGTIHISMDAARAGGRDAEVGCFYHCGAKATAWFPPMAVP